MAVLCPRCGATLSGPAWACEGCGLDESVRTFLPLLPAGAESAAFPEESFELLPELEETSFWFNARNDLIAWAFRRFFPDAASFLDLGCGTGFVLAGLRARFPSIELAGAERSAAALEKARSRAPGVPLFQVDAHRVPFVDAFDVVGAFDVIEHIADDVRVLEGMHHACRPGGGVLITVPQHPTLWSAVDVFSQHERRYTARELLRKLRGAGFEPVFHTSFVTLLLPVVALSRLRRRGETLDDPAAEYRLSPKLARIFGALMSVERRWLIERGVRLPAGSSLLVVARRA